MVNSDSIVRAQQFCRQLENRK